MIEKTFVTGLIGFFRGYGDFGFDIDHDLI